MTPRPSPRDYNTFQAAVSEGSGMQAGGTQAWERCASCGSALGPPGLLVCGFPSELSSKCEPGAALSSGS